MSGFGSAAKIEATASASRLHKFVAVGLIPHPIPSRMMRPPADLCGGHPPEACCTGVASRATATWIEVEISSISVMEFYPDNADMVKGCR
jgi:hypothetical protein